MAKNGLTNPQTHKHMTVCAKISVYGKIYFRKKTQMKKQAAARPSTQESPKSPKKKETNRREHGRISEYRCARQLKPVQYQSHIKSSTNDLAPATSH